MPNPSAPSLRLGERDESILDARAFFVNLNPLIAFVWDLNSWNGKGFNNTVTNQFLQ
ncbi:MAG: hypothetical protein P8Y18_07505 [Candidatus Bathyarchaeota archaeon]